MKIISFETKDYETADFAKADDYGLEATLVAEELTSANVALVQGCEGVTTLGFSDLRAPMIEELAKRGVRYIATRTVGFNHIDLKAAKKCGIRVSNEAAGREAIDSYHKQIDEDKSHAAEVAESARAETEQGDAGTEGGEDD